MENKGWIAGRWIEKEGERRRCFYRLTPKGVKALAEQREIWQEFADAIDQAIGWSHA